MTQENYKKAERMGITGPDYANCVAAALDLISAQSSISDDTYINYHNGFLEQEINGANSRTSRDYFMNILIDLGTGSFKNLILRKVSTPEKSLATIRKLRQGGFRIAIVTADQHIVGLQPVSKDEWKMKGTWIPVDPKMVLSTDQLFDYIRVTSERFKGKNVANILALVPERKIK